MKFAAFSLLCAALLPSAGVWAQDPIPVAPAPASVADVVVPDAPYTPIVARNMFALVPIPPAVTNDPSINSDPPPKITANGIMTIFGRDQALFKVATKAKTGQPAKDDTYVLAEGERQDDIEVVKIDHLNGLITFNNHGTVQELPLVVAKDGAGPAGPAAGPGGPRVGGILPGAGARRRAGNFAPSGMGAGGGGANTFNNGGLGVNGNSSGGNPSQATNQQPQAIEDQIMSAQRQMELIEQNRIATQSLVDQGKLPPLPPTSLTPPAPAVPNK
jgi:hypothetical protein